LDARLIMMMMNILPQISTALAPENGVSIWVLNKQWLQLCDKLSGLTTHKSLVYPYGD
jgi:hypothetical protein